MRVLATILLLGFAKVLTAQELTYDSLYVKRYNRQVAVVPSIGIRSHYFDFNQAQTKDFPSSRFSPNTQTSLGATFFYRGLAISGSLKGPDYGFSAKNFNKSEIRELKVQLSPQRFHLTADYLYYKGMTDINSPKHQLAVSGEDIYYFREDMTNQQYRMRFTWIFNHKKYSHRAAFRFREKQQKSAGSFLLNGNLFQQRLRGDSAFFAPSVRDSYGNMANLYDFKVFFMGVNAGYGYTFVYRGFFLAGTAFAGFMPQINSYKRGNGIEKDAYLYPYYQYNVSIGYNGQRVFYGFLLDAEYQFNKIESIRLKTRYQFLTFVWGMRIDPPHLFHLVEKKLGLQLKK